MSFFWRFITDDTKFQWNASSHKIITRGMSSLFLTKMQTKIYLLNYDILKVIKQIIYCVLIDKMYTWLIVACLSSSGNLNKKTTMFKLYRYILSFSCRKHYKGSQIWSNERPTERRSFCGQSCQPEVCSMTRKI